MTFLWVLDTNQIRYFQNGNKNVIRRIKEKKPEHLAITIITVEEQMKGWLKEINDINKYQRNQPDKFKRILWAYDGLSQGIKFFKNIQVLDFTESAYDCYQELVKQKTGVATQDLRIAAITLSVDGVLVTSNRRDFEKIPNLKFEDWTIN